jgi:ribosomal protein L9
VDVCEKEKAARQTAFDAFKKEMKKVEKANAELRRTVAELQEAALIQQATLESKNQLLAARNSDNELEFDAEDNEAISAAVSLYDALAQVVTPNVLKTMATTTGLAEVHKVLRGF